MFVGNFVCFFNTQLGYSQILEVLETCTELQCGLQVVKSSITNVNYTSGDEKSSEGRVFAAMHV